MTPEVTYFYSGAVVLILDGVNGLYSTDVCHFDGTVTVDFNTPADVVLDKIRESRKVESPWYVNVRTFNKIE